MTPRKPLLTTAEVVELLAEMGVEITQESVRRWARQGQLPTVNRGPLGRKLYRREDVVALVASGQRGAA